MAKRKVRIAKRIHIDGSPARRGAHMTKGKGWQLATTKGRRRVFAGTLLWTKNFGRKRIAVFSVPK